MEELWILLSLFPHELREHQSFCVCLKAQNEKVLGSSLSEATLWFYSIHCIWWVCSSFSLCNFPLFWEALFFGYFCIFWVSSFRYGVTFLSHVMVRGCKVRTLQPKTSPLSQFIEWNMSLAIMIGISLLRLCSMHQLCSMLYFWDPIICFLC